MQNYSFGEGLALFHSSAAFDMSITSIFLPLIKGNTLYIMAEDMGIDSLVQVVEERDDLSLSN